MLSIARSCENSLFKFWKLGQWDRLDIKLSSSLAVTLNYLTIIRCASLIISYSACAITRNGIRFTNFDVTLSVLQITFQWISRWHTVRPGPVVTTLDEQRYIFESAFNNAQSHFIKGIIRWFSIFGPEIPSMVLRKISKFFDPIIYQSWNIWFQSY